MKAARGLPDDPAEEAEAEAEATLAEAPEELERVRGDSGGANELRVEEERSCLRGMGTSMAGAGREREKYVINLVRDLNCELLAAMCD